MTKGYDARDAESGDEPDSTYALQTMLASSSSLGEIGRLVLGSVDEDWLFIDDRELSGGVSGSGDFFHRNVFDLWGGDGHSLDGGGVGRAGDGGGLERSEHGSRSGHSYLPTKNYEKCDLST